MTNYDKFIELIAYAKRQGYYHPPSKPILVRDGRIVYDSHYSTMFNATFLKAVYGKKYEDVALGALELVLHGGDPITCLYGEYLQVRDTKNEQDEKAEKRKQRADDLRRNRNADNQGASGDTEPASDDREEHTEEKSI